MVEAFWVRGNYAMRQYTYYEPNAREQIRTFVLSYDSKGNSNYAALKLFTKQITERVALSADPDLMFLKEQVEREQAIFIAEAEVIIDAFDGCTNWSEHEARLTELAELARKPKHKDYGAW